MSEITSIGSTVRMERHYRAEYDANGDPKLDASGQAYHLYTVYKKVTVKGGKHPMSGEETTEAFVWVPKGTGTKTEMQALAKTL